MCDLIVIQVYGHSHGHLEKSKIGTKQADLFIFLVTKTAQNQNNCRISRVCAHVPTRKEQGAKPTQANGVVVLGGGAVLCGIN